MNNPYDLTGLDPEALQSIAEAIYAGSAGGGGGQAAAPMQQGGSGWNFDAGAAFNKGFNGGKGKKGKMSAADFQTFKVGDNNKAHDAMNMGGGYISDLGKSQDGPGFWETLKSYF